MPNQVFPALDSVFHSLADPTRRAVLERLSRGPAAVSELSQASSMALPSFMQHLRVLEESGLAVSAKSGRVRTYRLVPQSLMAAEGWLHTQKRVWEARLDQLDGLLQNIKDQNP